jgi:hypothetical protein
VQFSFDVGQALGITYDDWLSRPGEAGQSLRLL